MTNDFQDNIPLNSRNIMPITMAHNSSRADIINAVKALSPDAVGEASTVLGGRAEAETRLVATNPQAYGRTRNHTDGAVTMLGPYIRHGVMTLNEVRNYALSTTGKGDAEKFIQQLAWRDYWQRLYAKEPNLIWEDAEDYKTGFTADDYVDELPDDIARGQTGVACIDHFLSELLTRGTMHNHGRLYVAAYVCHFRRVKWQAGARFFLAHLLDGDPASNNLSWQWVASTFSQKPYFFNLDNVRKFTGPDVDTSAQNNAVLNASYDALRDRLFPDMPERT